MVLKWNECPYKRQEIRHRCTGEKSRWKQRKRLNWWICISRKAKDCQQPTDTTIEAWDRFSLRAARRSQHYWHFDFSLQPTRLWEKYIAVVLSNQGCGSLLQHPLETNTININDRSIHYFWNFPVYLSLDTKCISIDIN